MKRERERERECADERKRAKYEELEQRAKQAGYTTNLITLEVGSHGIINMPGFQTIKEHLKIKEKAFTTMLLASTV